MENQAAALLAIAWMVHGSQSRAASQGRGEEVNKYGNRERAALAGRGWRRLVWVYCILVLIKQLINVSKIYSGCFIPGPVTVFLYMLV